MPCYHFTYHAFGSWMLDHPRGYVHCGQGILPPDAHMAKCYRGNLKQAIVQFTPAIQREMIDGVLEASQFQQLRCHFIASDSTHIHILVSWRSDRSWQLARKQIRGNITRRLNSSVQRQQWFSKSPSRKRVHDRTHFDHLMQRYLPKHSGWKWSESRGYFR